MRRLLLLVFALVLPATASAQPAPLCTIPRVPGVEQRHSVSFDGITAYVGDRGGLLSTAAEHEGPAFARLRVRVVRGAERITRITFSTNGFGSATARQAPYTFGLVEGRGALAGLHELRTTVIARGGRRSSVTFPFRVTRCPLAQSFVSAYRFKGRPTASLDAFGVPGLRRVVVRRPSGTRPSLSRVRSGARIGTLKIYRSDRNVPDVVLRRPGSLRDPALLYRSGATSLTFSAHGPAGKLLDARGLPSTANAITVTLTGAGVAALGLPSACRTLRYPVTVLGPTGIARPARPGARRERPASRAAVRLSAPSVAALAGFPLSLPAGAGAQSALHGTIPRVSGVERTRSVSFDGITADGGRLSFTGVERQGRAFAHFTRDPVLSARRQRAAHVCA